MKDKKTNLIIAALLVQAAITVATSCSKESDLPVVQQEETDASSVNAEQADVDKKNSERVVFMLPKTQDITLTSEQKQMVERSNRFAYSLFLTTSSDEERKGKSLLMSPLSLMYVLGMLNDGANGDTEKEISSFFGMQEGSKPVINGYCQALMTQAPIADPSVTLQTANIVATANDLKTSFQYKENLLYYYAAETASLDFTQPSALQFLNDWCNEKTQGIIPSILDEIDPATRMVLMNAVYFRATWAGKFDPADTRDETFIGEDGQSNSVPMMHRKAIALFAEGGGYSMLCLPYGSGTQWQMMVLLPNEGTTVDDVVSSLISTPWEFLWQRNRSQYEVDIKMPRFSTESDVMLNNSISQMGAPLMFSSLADFSQMTESGKPLCVSLIKQKVAIEVDEEGTQAAAATAATMVSTSLGPTTRKVDFHANHPFVYIIREASSGAVFFIGTYRGV